MSHNLKPQRPHEEHNKSTSYLCVGLISSIQSFITNCKTYLRGTSINPLTTALQHMQNFARGNTTERWTQIQPLRLRKHRLVQYILSRKNFTREIENIYNRPVSPPLRDFTRENMNPPTHSKTQMIRIQPGLSQQLERMHNGYCVRQLSTSRLWD